MRVLLFEFVICYFFVFELLINNITARISGFFAFDEALKVPYNSIEVFDLSFVKQGSEENTSFF